MNPKRFWPLFALLLASPAAVVLATGYDGLNYFLWNYGFMAAPHLLVAFAVLWPRARCMALLVIMAVLTLVLAAFKWWLWGKPDGGLGWILYPVIWISELLFAISVLHVRRLNTRSETQAR